jgi:drug/metabolite transporter (DMT)-like permease
MNGVQYDPKKGFIFSSGGALLLSTNFITVKYGLRGFNPETFSLVWTSAAAIYAFGIVLAGRDSRKKILPKGAVKAVVALGACTGLGMVLAWKGLSELDPVFASFLWRFLPVLSILSGVIILKERLALTEALAMGIMLIGALWSVVGRWNVVGTGVMLTIAAIFSGVLQLLIAKSQTHKVHPNVLVAYRVGIGSVLIACWVFATGAVNFAVEIKYWYVTLLGAFLGPCASFLFTFRAYRYWTLSQSSLTLTAQPLFTLPMAYIFLCTLPTTRELIGGCIILVGAFWLGFIELSKANNIFTRNS